jgi:hypothetical protein
MHDLSETRRMKLQWIEPLKVEVLPRFANLPQNVVWWKEHFGFSYLRFHGAFLSCVRENFSLVARSPSRKPVQRPR